MVRLPSVPALNCKAVYFWYYASYVSFASFLPVYYAEQGLSEVQVGLINALQRWLAAPATLGWALLADRLGAYRAVLLGAFASAVCTRTATLLSNGFTGILRSAVVAKVFSCAVNVVMDVVVMQLRVQGATYGNFRLWGTVGYGAFSVVNGYLIRYLGTRWSFCIQAVLAVPCLVHCSLVDSGQGRPAAKSSAPGGKGGKTWRQLAELLQRCEVVTFWVAALAMGFGVGAVDSFLLLHLEQLGASGSLMGLALTVTCLSEVRAYQLQAWLLERLGVDRLLDLIQVLYVLVLALYAALPALGDVRWVLAVELLRGGTFACGWGTGAVKSKGLAPAGLEATMLGTYRALYYGVGCGLGSLAGGWLGGRFGYSAMFACISVMLLGCWLCKLGAHCLTGVREKADDNKVKAD